MWHGYVWFSAGLVLSVFSLGDSSSAIASEADQLLV
jgi:hypothetical protein